MDCKMENLSKKQIELLQDINTYTPGGMHICHLSDPIHLEYASDGLCKMLGYTRKEFEEKTKDFYLTNVPKKYYKTFYDFCFDLSKDINKKTVQYEMIKKDGSKIIVSDTMESVLCDDGAVRGYSSVTDITEQKIIEEKLNIQKNKYIELYEEVKRNEEKLKMISAFSGIMFFEYNIESQTYTSLDNTEIVLFYTAKELKELLAKIDGEADYHPPCGLMYHLLHEEDKIMVKENSHNFFKNKEAELELRMLCKDGNYHWFSMEMHIAENNENIIMGCIRNIDTIKAYIENLEKKASIDQMTGLMNKVSGLYLIDELLKDKPKNNFFVLLDLDNFKWINDKLGHDVGDKVLQFAATTMKNIFRRNDIFVRYGGDEMIIFCPNLDNKRVIISRLIEFNKQALNCPYLENTDLILQASFGVAISDQNSTAYSLTLESDKFMYKSKKTRKGYICYDGVLYNDKLEIVE